MSFSNLTPSVRPRDALLLTMREDCRLARQASKIGLDDDAMDLFLLDVLPAAPSDEDRASWLASGFRLPLQYPSLHAELNVVCHLCMLNSLSGYRAAFHRALGQGAHKTIVQIVMSLYLSDPAGDDARPLSAATLSALTPMLLLDRLGLRTHDEKPHPSMPAVTVGTRRRDELYEALETLCIGANDTGRRLQAMQCPDLGTLVEQLLSEANSAAKRDDVRASLFASNLMSALPVFDDSHAFADGLTPAVHIHKRALLLLSWLHSAFAKRPSPPPLFDPAVLPAFVDNVIPSLLVHFGILDLSRCEDDGLRRWHDDIINAKTESSGNDASTTGVLDGPTLTCDEAYRVRAAAVDACHALVERAHVLGPQQNRAWLSSLTEALLDGWLWTQAKRPDLTVVPRLVEKKTFMY